jgi:hypothetical protein
MGDGGTPPIAKGKTKQLSYTNISDDENHFLASGMLSWNI